MIKMTKVVRRCPYCKQDMSIEKGLSSDNIKRLFRKPTLEDMIILIVLALAIISFLAYNYDIKACRAYIDNNCTLGQHNQQQMISPDNLIANPNFTAKSNITNLNYSFNRTNG